jgi:hypothetical protein
MNIDFYKKGSHKSRESDHRNHHKKVWNPKPKAFGSDVDLTFRTKKIGERGN